METYPFSIFPMSNVTVDIDLKTTAAPKKNHHQPNQNYPALTAQECRVVADKVMALRKESNSLSHEDVAARFPSSDYDNPRAPWQAPTLYRSPIFQNPDMMVDWMLKYDTDWLKKHPPINGNGSSEKPPCKVCGTELKFKLVCPCCNKIIS
jgi:hypothetical protein